MIISMVILVIEQSEFRIKLKLTHLSYKKNKIGNGTISKS